jgi:hypothetical protein
VLARRGDDVQFNPRLLEFAAHYHFAPRLCRPARGNEKGRVERAIQYIRSSFFAAWPFTTLEDFNRQARIWCEGVAAERMWVEDDSRTVGDVFREEQPRLLQLPAHRFESDLLIHPLGKNHLCPLRSQSMKTGSETAIAGDLKASQ